MRTVFTVSELESALKSGEKHILCKGEVARKLQKVNKVKKTAPYVGGAMAVIGALGIPFTGGLSGGLAAAGVALTVGTVTISVAELIIIVGGTIAAIGILMGKKVTLKFRPDGCVEVDVN